MRRKRNKLNIINYSIDNSFTHLLFFTFQLENVTTDSLAELHSPGILCFKYSKILSKHFLVVLFETLNLLSSSCNLDEKAFTTYASSDKKVSEFFTFSIKMQLSTNVDQGFCNRICSCCAKGGLGPIQRTEKYRTPTGSCSSRSKQTAHDATRRSVWRLRHCTLGRLALLFRLLSLLQPFRSTLFSSKHTQRHNKVTIIHTKQSVTIIFVKVDIYSNMKLLLIPFLKLHVTNLHNNPPKTTQLSNYEMPSGI